MIRTTVLTLAVLLLLASGDTLDFGRRLIVVSDIESRNVEQLDPDYIRARVLDVLRAVHYDRDWSVAAFLGAHAKEAGRLERMALESRRTNTKFRSDGVVTVDYEVPVSTGILEQLLPPLGGGRLLGRLACPTCGQAWPEDREVPEGVEPVPLEEDGAAEWTGVLFDARGLELEPALFPRVVIETDEEVYGPAFAVEGQLAENGMAVYYQHQSDAWADSRIGPNPLVVRALSVTGTNNCDLVISRRDAGRAHSTMANIDLLRGCRVGFLVD